MTFWDELANVANQHIEKGQQIYVSGRLISDTVEGDDGKEQTYYKVALLILLFGCYSDVMFVLYLIDCELFRSFLAGGCSAIEFC